MLILLRTWLARTDDVMYYPNTVATVGARQDHNDSTTTVILRYTGKEPPKPISRSRLGDFFLTIILKVLFATDEKKL